MGGLPPFNTFIPYLGEDRGVKDFNDIKGTCVLYCGNNIDWRNMPTGCSDFGGILEHFEAHGGARGMQRYTDRGKGLVSTRRIVDDKTFSEWSEWK